MNPTDLLRGVWRAIGRIDSRYHGLSIGGRNSPLGDGLLAARWRLIHLGRIVALRLVRETSAAQ